MYGEKDTGLRKDQGKYRLKVIGNQFLEDNDGFLDIVDKLMVKDI